MIETVKTDSGGLAEIPTSEPIRLGRFLWAYVDHDGKTFFQNTRGMNINGNRVIHMSNWTPEDLEGIVSFLRRMEA